MNDVSQDPLPRLAERSAESHKGDFGRAMLIGGSRDMPGAIAMAGMACQRSGAGLTTLGVPKSIQSTVASYSPAYMTKGLVEDEAGTLYWANSFDLLPLEDQYTAWAFGPGLGDPFSTAELAGRLHRYLTRPLIIDADGLNALTYYKASFGPPHTEPLGPRILTPHPGEFGRLIGDERLAEMAKGDDRQRIEAATILAERDPTSQTVVVLKGHRTVVADGHRHAINATGNPGMATGGTGDVLTGMMTALLCQGLDCFDAARLAVYLHGKAGDLAAEKLGQVSLIATDLIDQLSTVFQQPL